MDERARDFVKRYLDGDKPTQAYMAAYKESDPIAAYPKAARLMRNPTIRAEIKRLQDKVDEMWLLSREEKREILAKIMLDEEGYKPSDRLKAIELDNRMAGHDAPAEVHVTGINELIASVRANAQ